MCDAIFLLQVNAAFTINKSKIIDTPTFLLYPNNKIVLMDSMCIVLVISYKNWQLLFFLALKNHSSVKPLAPILFVCKRHNVMACVLFVQCPAFMEEMTGLNVLYSRLFSFHFFFFVGSQYYSSFTS